ncbi:MAG: alpha/beta hydrolase [Clostridia bacterium]
MQSRLSKIVYKSLKRYVGPMNACEATDYVKTRQDMEDLARMLKIDKNVELTCINLENCSMEYVHVPHAPDNKIIMYIHGGGFTSGSVICSRKYITEFCLKARLNAISCEYRLAPEHTYPAALEDCVEIYEYLLSNGYKGRDIAITGESAGGTLSLNLVLYLKDHHMDMPAAVCAMCPVGDITGRLDSRERNIKVEALLQFDLDGKIRETYVGNADAKDPYISPIYGDFHNFPPLLLQLGENEILYDDSVMLYEKAKNAGVKVSLSIWEHMWHGFQLVVGMPEANEAIQEAMEFMSKYLKNDRYRSFRVIR